MTRPLAAPDTLRRLILGSGAVSLLALVLGASTSSALAGDDEDRDNRDDEDDGDDEDDNDEGPGDDGEDDDDRTP